MIYEDFISYYQIIRVKGQCPNLRNVPSVHVEKVRTKSTLSLQVRPINLGSSFFSFEKSTCEKKEGKKSFVRMFFCICTSYFIPLFHFLYFSLPLFSLVFLYLSLTFSLPFFFLLRFFLFHSLFSFFSSRIFSLCLFFSPLTEFCSKLKTPAKEPTPSRQPFQFFQPPQLLAPLQ